MIYNSPKCVLDLWLQWNALYSLCMYQLLWLRFSSVNKTSPADSQPIHYTATPSASSVDFSVPPLVLALPALNSLCRPSISPRCSIILLLLSPQQHRLAWNTNGAMANPTAVHTSVNMVLPRSPRMLRSGRSSNTERNWAKSTVEVRAAPVVKKAARKAATLALRGRGCAVKLRHPGDAGGGSQF